MVKEFVCDLCLKTFATREEAEDCKSRCQRFAESPRIEDLNLSNRTFNLLYGSELLTVRDIEQMSEKDLKKIKGFGNWCLKELKEKIAEYGIEDDQAPTCTNQFKYKATLSTPQLNSKLDDKLKERLAMFVGSLDWPRHYKQYYHNEDFWENGFYNMVELEKGISEHIALGYLTRQDILNLARWERLHAKDRMKYPDVLSLKVSCLSSSEWLFRKGTEREWSMDLC